MSEQRDALREQLAAMEPCRTCDGLGFVETAAPDSRVIHYEPCPECSGPVPAPTPLVHALVQEYAAVLARRGAWEKPAILGHAEQKCYLHGVYTALERVAERLGVVDLHARAAEVVARGPGEQRP